MQHQKQKSISLQEYKRKADETLRKIIDIRMRVQRKVDELAYKKQLTKLHE